MTNHKEKQYLIRESHQTALGKALSQSIKEFLTDGPKEDKSQSLKTLVLTKNPSKGIKVYFPQKGEDRLAAEFPTVTQPTSLNNSNIKQSLEVAVKALIAGPRSPTLEQVVNPKTKVLGIDIHDGIAALNFSEEFTTMSPGSYQELMAVNSLVHTVCQFRGIDGLKILIEGEAHDTLVQHIDISRVLTPDPPKCQLAVVIDDLAGRKAGLEELMALNRPLTMAVMPKHPTSRTIAQYVHQRGYQVFLHLPMEAMTGRPEWVGEGAITDKMTPQEAVNQVKEDLADVPYVVGMNNHMGSKITKRKDIMVEILKLAKAEHLTYLDSRTTDQTVAPELAKGLNIPILERTVFLDVVNSRYAIKKQIRASAEVAKQKGFAVAIGHVGISGKNTAQALAEMLPWLDEQGIELVFASELTER